MQYNLNRWYDPVIGQWMSEDPIGFAAGDANLRRMVGNSVMLFVDPLGHEKSEALKEVEKELHRFIPQLKEIAKLTGKKGPERAGVVLKDNDKFTIVEFLDKRNTSHKSHKCLFSSVEDKPPYFVPKPNDKGVVDCDMLPADPNDIKEWADGEVFFGWHTHPAFPEGDPEPFQADRTNAKKQKLIEVVIQHSESMLAGKKVEKWAVHIIDIDGMFYEYELKQVAIVRLTCSLRWVLTAIALVCALFALLSAELAHSAKVERHAADLADSGLTVNTSTAIRLFHGRYLFYRIEGIIARGDTQYQCLLTTTPVCDGIGVYDASIKLEDLLTLAHSSGCKIISIRRCEIETAENDECQPNFNVVELRHYNIDSRSLEVLSRLFPKAHVFEN